MYDFPRRRDRSRNLLLLLLLLTALFFWSCTTGQYRLTAEQILLVLRGIPQSPMDGVIFRAVRVPRNVTAGICGAALASAGFLYQELFRNPLASPDLLGVSGGASAGAICAILFGTGGIAEKQLFSFTGGLTVVLCSVLLSSAIGGNRYFNLVISGIILSALTNSAIMALKYLADPTSELAAIDYWLMGSYSLAGWNDFRICAPVILTCLTVLFLLRYRIKVLTLGPEEAQTLGIPVRSTKRICILCSTLLVTASICISGIVSWVGLIVPHLARALFGSDFEHNLAETALLGAILTLAADTCARNLTSSELPISILTTAFGAVCLAAFLISVRRTANH